MTLWLKQSTAKVVSFGPFLDKADGVTEETGLVSALDHASTGIKLSKNGGALTIRHATVTATTYDAYGMYLVTLDTTDTGTVGTLRMAFNEAATCLPVWQDFMVLPANVYDSLVGGTDALDVSAIQFAGQTITASGGVTIPAATLASTTNITAGTIATVTTLTNLPAATTDWLTAASVKADAVTKIQNGLATPTNITAGTITTTTNLTNLPAAAALEATLTAMKGATFAGATDSLEAIRDRGDAAWATATGFSTLDAAGVRTAVGLATANLDTQIATLATPTNITAGTITTVTNLTNAPTNGDLTATMKTSVTTAATAATPIAASVAGAVGSVTAAVTLPTIPTNWITADGIATDAFGALELAAGAASEIAAAISIPSAATIASQVRTELTTELAHITLAKKILKNRTETNPATGVMTVYDDDGTTPLYTANLYTDVAGATAYDGTAGVNRRNALA